MANASSLHSIQTITYAIEEGVNGVTSAAESTQLLVTDMSNISDRMAENQEIAESVKIFLKNKGVAENKILWVPNA